MAASEPGAVTLDQRFAEAMGQLLGPDFPSDIALAVSGGGDSMAMLYLAHNWSHVWGVRLHVVTVDHGLRPEAADEAAMVAAECAALGWPHATLRWHWDGTGNKMDAARRGRLDLIDGWRGDIAHVLMAHTRDDVAETFLMRLKRGSGADGLAAMQAARVMPGQWQVLRPCLDMGRDALRHYLRVLQGRWVEDPSNDDPGYERVAMRRLLPLLEAQGFDRAGLAATAERLREERAALAVRAAQVWDAVGQDHGWGGVSFAPGWYEGVEIATRRRVLAAALRHVAAADYGPRAEPLDALLARVTSGGGGTLHGCEAAILKGRLTIFREYAAVRDVTCAVADGVLWDNRWRVCGNEFKGLTLRALGEDGWQQVADRPGSAPPHRVALSLPSFWRGGTLVACDALGHGPGGTVALVPWGHVPGGLGQFLLSH